MTALNDFLESQLVMVCADTLRTDPSRRPTGFASKVLTLPHLHGLMCSRGSLQLLADWYVFVQMRVVAVDMGQLDDVATESLRELWDKQPDKPATSSIYHFGLDGSAGRLRGWRYRSGARFQSEQLQDETLGSMPAVERLIRPWAEAQTVDERIHAFVHLLQVQHDWDRSQDATRPCGIGGEVHVLALNRDCQALWSCYQFDDFSSDHELSLRNA